MSSCSEVAFSLSHAKRRYAFPEQLFGLSPIFYVYPHLLTRVTATLRIFFSFFYLFLKDLLQLLFGVAFNFSLQQVEIPETSEVRFIDTELEKLDYSKLYGGLRQKGRKSAVDAKTMFKVIVYAYERGIYSSRKIEEACRVRIDFRWLLNGEKIPDHCAISRFRKKHKEELEDFFCQYVRILEAEEETDH